MKRTYDAGGAEIPLHVTTEVTAVTLLYKLIATEVEVVKAANSPRGISKRLEKQERDAITDVFRALTGQEPTTEQLAEINKF